MVGEPQSIGVTKFAAKEITMQIHLTDEQLNTLVGLVDSRVKEIHPEIRRSRVYTVHDELKHDLEVLLGLQEQLHEAQNAADWEGYIETRKTPSNPPPGA